MGQSVIDSFRLEIAIASPSFASLLLVATSKLATMTKSDFIYLEASFFVLSYSLPLALIVALYSVMLHTLWNKVLKNIQILINYV